MAAFPTGHVLELQTLGHPASAIDELPMGDATCSGLSREILVHRRNAFFRPDSIYRTRTPGIFQAKNSEMNQ
jgi:hypothetical protein